MSIAGSDPSAAAVPPAPETAATQVNVPRRRTPLVRWRGLIPRALLLGLLAIGWFLFGEPITEVTFEEAAT